MFKKFICYTFFFLNICLLTACDRVTESIVHGYIEGDFTYVAAQATGLLDQLNVFRGDSVIKNQLLFVIDPEPQASEVNQAKAKLREVQANLANLQKGKRQSEIDALEATRRQIMAKLAYAKKTVERYQLLVNQDVLEKSKLDEAISDYDHLQAGLDEIKFNLETAKSEARVDEIAAAKANIEEAKAALKEANWQLAQKKVYSPIAGYVVDVYYRTGELISSTYPVLSLLAPQDVYVIFFVPEAKLGSLQLKQKVYITCDQCPAPVKAEIRFISPKAEFTPPVIYSEKTRVNLVYKVEASLSPEDAKTLHPGQPVTVQITED
jgi:HlyD family secretion protein